MKPVLVIGSTCVDIIINVDHLPQTAENIQPRGQAMALGGCAYNVAYVMKLLKAPFHLMSPVGGGVFGDYVVKELKEKGFEIPVYLPDQENGCCYCFVESSGERTFLSCHGAEYTFRKEWMEPYSMDSYSMLYLCGLEVEEPTGIDLVEFLEERPGPEIFFAPGPRGKWIDSERIERIYRLHPVLHINEQEAMELSGCTDFAQAAQALMEKTGNTVIVTLGDKGTYCLEKGGDHYTIPAPAVSVSDTIGAGDSHIGAILACLSRDIPMREAVAAANRVAAAVVSVPGASLTQEQADQALAGV